MRLGPPEIRSCMVIAASEVYGAADYREPLNEGQTLALETPRTWGAAAALHSAAATDDAARQKSEASPGCEQFVNNLLPNTR